MPSDTYLDRIKSRKEKLIKKFEQRVQALKDLVPGDVTMFSIGYDFEPEPHNKILGRILDIKDDNILIEILAAEKIDFKVRNTIMKRGRRSVRQPKKHYPIAIELVKESRTFKFKEVPLLINYAFISEQFKNRYLR